ncbi:FixH family protein [Cohnella thailandensis]|uniref:FixH family protein n=1 Tax=Cohnella thailandensis TaxID=557557 RepID=A0A841T979_9BACL|nr:FixH family protein [Cohnella thailandensis]MBB6638407.1 FixH family protein [Cohnella thailandensis]MBP1977115.1 hypothetical protein [Cohnella thailandensis]
MSRLLKKGIWPIALVICLGIVVWLSRSGEASPVPLVSTLEKNGYRIEVRTLEARSSPMEEKQFLVTVTDVGGANVEATSIQIKSWMPKMFCGIFTAKVERSSQGSGYEGTLVPVMSGRWVAETRVRIGSDEFVLLHDYKVV